MIDTAKTPQAVTLLGQTTGEGVSLASCFEAHKLLVKLAGAESAAATAHKAACLQLYPLSTFFGAGAWRFVGECWSVTVAWVTLGSCCAQWRFLRLSLAASFRIVWWRRFSDVVAGIRAAWGVLQQVARVA